MPDFQPFLAVGNDPALDFVNTLPVDAEGRPDERLKTPADLGRWLVAFGLVEKKEAFEPSRRTLDDARALRESLRGMAEALARGRAVPASSIASIHEALEADPGVLVVERKGKGYDLRFRSISDAGRAALGSVARAAAYLLARRDLSRVRRCANPECVLYFYDATRNRGRQWCSMASCGNRAKIAAYRARQSR